MPKTNQKDKLSPPNFLCISFDITVLKLLVYQLLLFYLFFKKISFVVCYSLSWWLQIVYINTMWLLFYLWSSLTLWLLLAFPLPFMLHQLQWTAFSFYNTALLPVSEILHILFYLAAASPPWDLQVSTWKKIFCGRHFSILDKIIFSCCAIL